jgi:hypothetical protein
VLHRRWRHRRRSVHSNRVGWGIEPRNGFIAGAEAVGRAEGNMNGAVMQGAATLPRSKNPSRAKGSRRNLGDLTPPAVAEAIPGRDRKSRRRSCRGRRAESDRCIVPRKPSNKAERSAAERVEGRRLVTGRSGRQPTLRAQTRVSVSHASARSRCAPVGPSPARRNGTTCDKSPVRESCPPGSARGGLAARPVPTATSLAARISAYQSFVWSFSHLAANRSIGRRV